MTDRLPDLLTPAVCRVESIRWADAAHAVYRHIPVAERERRRDLYDDICQVRQVGIALAALAGDSSATDGGRTEGDQP